MKKLILLILSTVASLNLSSRSFAMTIFEAIEKNDLQAAKRILSGEGFDVNQPREEDFYSPIDSLDDHTEYETPLYIACKEKNICFVEELLNHNGISVNKGRDITTHCYDRACFRIGRPFFDREDGIDKPMGTVICKREIDYRCVYILKILLENGAYIVKYKKVGKNGEEDAAEIIEREYQRASNKKTPFWQQSFQFKLGRTEEGLVLRSSIQEQELLCGAYHFRLYEQLRYLKLAKNLDNAEDKIKFIESQMRDEDANFLCKRLLSKYGIKYQRPLIRLKNEQMKALCDCTVICEDNL